MGLIYDTVTASNIAGYFNTSQLNVDSTLGERIFPARKQLGTKLSYIKGSSGRAVVLKPAAFDTNVTIRERVGAEIHDEQMPFFKEAMLVKEADRQQLNLIAGSNNTGLIETITQGIFNDKRNLTSCESLHAHRFQTSTGTLDKCHFVIENALCDSLNQTSVVRSSD